MIKLVTKHSILRSVCLSDALSFYHGDKACGFQKTDFAKVFIGIYCAYSQSTSLFNADVLRISLIFVLNYT